MKHSNKLFKSIETNYKTDLGYRSDAKLSTVLKLEGYLSISKLLKMAESSRK